MAFSPRVSCPRKGNPYYTAKKEGGLNPAIARPDGSKLIFQNCVFYAIGRFAELWGIWLRSTNAENFVTVAREMGLTVSQIPQEGAIACWEGIGNLAGHVATVEIKNAHDIVTSESGWSANKPFWTQTRRNDGNWGADRKKYKFLGFILPPSAKPNPAKEEKPMGIRKGDKGDAVKKMQTALANKGYLRKTEIDGDFGRITLGAVLAFQFENGLEVDGICGSKTQAKLF